MNATLTALTIASFLFAATQAEDAAETAPMVVAPASEASASPYVEITQLPPVPAPRIIRAVPREQAGASGLVLPASAQVALQPVDAAATRPVLAAPAGPLLAPPTYPQITYGPPATPQVLYRPVVPLGGVTLGRGVIGQPKVYVEGQPLRNLIRWLSP